MRKKLFWTVSSCRYYITQYSSTVYNRDHEVLGFLLNQSRDDLAALVKTQTCIQSNQHLQQVSME